MIETTIRTHRRRQGLTQKELAEKTGLSVLTIFRYESGEREPRASDIQKLCEVFGCSETELLNGPAKNEWKIEIIWEVEELNAMAIEKDKFCIGFREGETLLWGSVPDEKTPDEVAEQIKRELLVAVKMREARNAEMKRLAESKSKDAEA